MSDAVRVRGRGALRVVDSRVVVHGTRCSGWKAENGHAALGESVSVGGGFNTRRVQANVLLVFFSAIVRLSEHVCRRMSIKKTKKVFHEFGHQQVRIIQNGIEGILV